MDARTVLLIRSREIGWAAVDAALRQMPGVRVVADTRCLGRGVELAAGLRPDVVLAAARLDGCSTRPALAGLRGAAGRTPVVLVFGGGIVDDELADDGLGIDGHLLWGELSAETLGPVLAALMSGDVVVASRSVLAAFVRSRHRSHSCHGQGPAPTLTPRERAVLAGLVNGRCRPDVAKREGISERTVERVVAELQTKLAAPTPYALGAAAVRLGLLDDCPAGAGGG